MKKQAKWIKSPKCRGVTAKVTLPSGTQHTLSANSYRFAESM